MSIDAWEFRQHNGLGVYRLWSAGGSLLYIGVSDNVARRLMQHQYRQWWWQVASVTVERFGDREKADRAERVAIATESPMYNRRGAPEGSTPRDRAWDAFEIARNAAWAATDPVARADARTSEYDLRACVELAEGRHPSSLTRNGLRCYLDGGNEAHASSDDAVALALAKIFEQVAS